MNDQNKLNKLVDHLVDGKKIDSVGAIKLFNIHDLESYISEIEKNIKLKSKWIPNAGNEFVRMQQYWV